MVETKHKSRPHWRRRLEVEFDASQCGQDFNSSVGGDSQVYMIERCFPQIGLSGE